MLKNKDINTEEPNPNEIFPVLNSNHVTYIRPTIQNPNIIVGEFSYFSDVDFENHVIHHYPWYGDRLIIGKFCQIAAGVRFIMNGANHQMNSLIRFTYSMDGVKKYLKYRNSHIRVILWWVMMSGLDKMRLFYPE